MKIALRSMARQEATDKIRSLKLEMENALSKLFEDVWFGAGIDQVTIIFDIISWNRSDKDCIQTVRNPFTQEKIKAIVLFVATDENVVVEARKPALRKYICDCVLHRIENPQLRIPKAFDYKGFAALLTTAVMLLSRARSLRAPPRKRRRTAAKVAN